METDAAMKNLLNLQRVESTLYDIYRHLAASEKHPERRQVLLRLMRDEKRHCDLLHERTGRPIAPDPKRVFRLRWMARILGPTFVVRRIERFEQGTAACYARFADGEFRRIAREERHHAQELIALADAEPLRYMSSIVLGLNDALVEFTGALAGFSLALGDSRLVALTGGITGIAAALSMAASEYLSTKSGRIPGKHPVRAALCTGITYLVTVALLILPYLLFRSVFVALAVMLVAALLIIALFNYYYAVIRRESFRRRFLEMAILSFGIAAISFAIGYGLKRLTGIDA